MKVSCSPLIPKVTYPRFWRAANKDGRWIYFIEYRNDNEKFNLETGIYEHNPNLKYRNWEQLESIALAL